MDPNASSITVAVRVRPFTIREAAQLVFDPPEDNPVQKFTRSVVPAAGKKVKDQVFAFDRIFDQTATQSDVYEATTKNLLDSILDGYNATVFAYGATGCGKTHTITGTSQHPGIIFLTMQELFEKINERSDEKVTEVSLSYLEIYNETIRDLLVPGGSKQGLMLREDSNQAVTVAGLTSHHPKDVQEVMDMIVQGNEYRTVSPTAANAVSSRSHAVLQINIAQKDRNADVNEPHTMATLSIIDLAGSERASATKNRGERLLEGANINKSLLALGSCINALCDPRKRNHVPYRNSKLTRLLKFSLGGNCKTVMIVCVSPSSEHFDETQNTLRYANRAKNIQTKVTRNVFNVNRHVKDFLVKIDEQMALIKELKAQQKDAEKTAFAKFRKQMDKRDVVVREGIVRLRAAYENAAAERLEKTNMMKKRKAIERRIGLLSAWIAAFDSVCDARGDEDAVPANLVAMRKTAHGILMELESSRHHIHQRLEKFNWERHLDTALNHSLSMLQPAGEEPVDGSERDTLAREVEMLKASFMRDAYREVLEQDKAGDAAVVQVLLGAQFEMLSSMSETLNMSEEEAVAHAKTMISRLLETGYSAASHVVKPDGSIMPVELFPPTKRGTPKRKKSVGTTPKKPIPQPAFLAAVQEQAAASPVKASPRRRRTANGRKVISFTPIKKKGGVRWRDDESEQGTLADFEKTPKKFPSPQEPSPPSPERTLPARPPVPSYLNHVDSPKQHSSSPTLPAAPEVSSLAFSKPNNRFQAGFLSKSRPSSQQQNHNDSVHGSPIPPTLSLRLTSSPKPETQDRPSPLRSLPVSRVTNSLSPPSVSANGSPKPSSVHNNNSHNSMMLSPLHENTSTSISLTPNNNENEPPRRLSPSPSSRLPRVSYGSGSDSELDPLKIRSALHLAKRRSDRLSLHSNTSLSSATSHHHAAAGRRVSSIGSISGLSGAVGYAAGGGAHRRASASYSGLGAGVSAGASVSSGAGISRHRRLSAERGGKRSPPRPIACSPPSRAGAGSSPLSGSGSRSGAGMIGGGSGKGGLTQGQARRMNIVGGVGAGNGSGSGSAGGSMRLAGGSPPSVSGGAEGMGMGVGGKARRITISGLAGGGGLNGSGSNNGGGNGNGGGGSVNGNGTVKPRPSVVWR
ncbi:P-loop containing nucleoside triphosphate hydrolase protein [Chaetomium sp. MPI-SDFR-AT-0129]|nr:P-loop containing nucleoside triphosphate hydrolase protein [Chaetomium sp. MPI-SDFR-AT-0129]